MKINYDNLCEFLEKNAPIDEISNKLFQLGHENEIDGNIIDVDITPNRGDCLSVKGLARDLGVFYNFIDNTKSYKGDLKKYDLKFINKSPDDCPYVSFLKIEIKENQGENYSDNLENYFKNNDVNKINLFTDISNYLAYECGQPTHCYDLDKINEEIEFHCQKVDSEFETLLDKKISLTGENCIFTSNNEIINLAGVMGGKNSSCSNNTKRVLVECAYFNPKSIIGKSLEYDLKSDAAHKFERGVDPIIHEEILRRFIYIVSQNAEITNLEFVNYSYKKFEPVCLDFDLNKISSILGHPLEEEDCLNILNSLNFKISNNKITAPSYRHDIFSQNDLAEEIARVIGYDEIESIEIPKISFNNSSENNDEYKVKNFLVENGFNEVINFPFSSISNSKSSVIVDNPLDSSKKYLRTELKDSLIENMLFNERRQNDSIKIFEISDLYDVENEVNYSKKLGLLISGRQGHNYKEFSKKLDIEYVISLFKKINYSLNEENVIQIDRSNLDTKIKNKIFYLEIPLIDLKNIEVDDTRQNIDFSQCIQFQEVSEYPSTSRDLSFLVTDSSKIENLHRLISNYNNGYLKNVFLFDLYENKDDETFKLGYRFIFQSNKTTLKDADVDEIMQNIITITTDLDGISIPGL